MTAEEVAYELQSLTTEASMQDQAADMTERWVLRRAPVSTLAVLFQFLERHPGWDFGAPGALVHFMERFKGNGYEEELLESIRRRPTPHTLWMLHRAINGETDSTLKQLLVKRLAEVLNSPRIDENIRDNVAQLLAIHRF